MGDHHDEGVRWDGQFYTAAGLRHTARELDGHASRAAGHHKMALAYPGQVDGLAVVLRAVTERSRQGRPVRALRPLTLVCRGERGHVIGRVYAVPGAGAVLVAEAPDWHSTGRTEWAQGTTTLEDPETGEPHEIEVDEQVPVHELVHRFEQFAAVLDEQGPHDRWVEIQCRCCSIDVSVSQLRRLLAAGRPRVRIGLTVMGPADTPTG